MANVTIVGLGYVGLPLACLCAEKGHKTTGLDIDKTKVDSVNAGKSPFEDERLNKKVPALKGKLKATTNPKDCIPQSDIVIVCVPTPIDKKNMPDLVPLIESTKTVAMHIKKGAILVIESTIYPGTIEDVVLPLLKKAGFNAEKDELLVCHCPERIDPGNKKWSVDILPRVIGGVTKNATKKAAEFYRSILSSDVMELSSVKAAEATKIMENTFRDINIAFINEMAQSFDKAGIDILEVIRGASSKPFAFMPHYPGAGVGGHCIPVDPYYLIEKAKQIGFNHRFLSLAREINNGMPNYTVELLESELKKLNIPIKGAKVGVLGLAYKANVDDTRESPAYEVIHHLKDKKANVMVFDPYVKDNTSAKSLSDVLKSSQAIVLVTDHDEFKAITPKAFKGAGVKLIIDGRNCLDKEALKSAGIAYHGIGRS